MLHYFANQTNVGETKLMPTYKSTTRGLPEQLLDMERS
jgi:hypothetical protein